MEGGQIDKRINNIIDQSRFEIESALFKEGLLSELQKGPGTGPGGQRQENEEEKQSSMTLKVREISQ